MDPLTVTPPSDSLSLMQNSRGKSTFDQSRSGSLSSFSDDLSPLSSELSVFPSLSSSRQVDSPLLNELHGQFKYPILPQTLMGSLSHGPGDASLASFSQSNTLGLAGLQSPISLEGDVKIHQVLSRASSEDLVRAGNVSYIQLYRQVLQLQTKCEDFRSMNDRLIQAVPQLLNILKSPSGLSDITSAMPSGATSAIPGSIPFRAPPAPTFTRESLPDIKFWIRHDYTEWKSLQGSAVSGQTGQRKRGATSSSKGENVRMLYLEDRTGKILNGHVAVQVRDRAREIWQTFKQYNIAPRSWGQANLEIKRIFANEMCAAFPELALCENFWKVDEVALGDYPQWRKRHLGASTESVKQEQVRSPSPQVHIKRDAKESSTEGKQPPQKKLKTTAKALVSAAPPAGLPSRPRPRMIATASGSTDVVSNPVIMSSSGSVSGSAPGSHSDSVPGPGPGSVSGTAILGSVSHSVVDLVVDSLSGSVIDSLSCSVVKSVSGSVVVQPLSGSAADSLSGSVAASLSGSVAASLSGSVAASVTAAAVSGSIADSLSGSPSVPLSSLPSEPGVPSTLQSAQLANLSSHSHSPDDISAGLDLEQCPTAAQDDQNTHPSEVVDKGKGKEVTVLAHVTARIVPKVKNPLSGLLKTPSLVRENQTENVATALDAQKETGISFLQCSPTARATPPIASTSALTPSHVAGKQVREGTKVTKYRPTKTSNSARNLFGRDYIIKNPNTTTQQFTQIWDNLDVATKQEYEQKALKLRSNKAAAAAAVNNATAT